MFKTPKGPGYTADQTIDPASVRGAARVSNLGLLTPEKNPLTKDVNGMSPDKTDPEEDGIQGKKPRPKRMILMTPNKVILNLTNERSAKFK